MSWFQNLQKQAQEALKVVQQDLQEFGHALKEDTDEVVTVVKTEAPKLQEKVQQETLPELQKISKDVTEDVQKSFSTVGDQLNAFGKSLVTGTTEMISQVQEAVNMEMENKKTKKRSERKTSRVNRDTTAVGANGKYSRYESQVSAMQRDSGTYCDEPADKEDFETWLSSFDLNNHQGAIEEVLKDNAFMQELQSRIVPLIVDKQTFWTRYFYRLSKLQEKHSQREQLVKRAAVPEEEELSWDVEDGDTKAEENTTTSADKEPASTSVASGGDKEASTSADTVGPEASMSTVPSTSGADKAKTEEAAVVKEVEELKLEDKTQADPKTIEKVEDTAKQEAKEEAKEKTAQPSESAVPVTEETSSDDTVSTGEFVVVKSPTKPAEDVPKDIVKEAPKPEESAKPAPSASKTASVSKTKETSVVKSDDLDEDWGADLDEDWGED